MTEALANALGIELNSPVEIYKDKEKALVTIDQANENKSDAEIDYEKVRSGTYELLDTSMSAIAQLADIASQSQDHESFSSLASLIKAAAGLQQDLMKLHHLKKSKDDEGKPNNVTNQLVISTADLQKMLSEKK